MTRMSNHSLIIDTTEYGRIVFSLDGKSKVYKILPQESDKILIYLDDFLKKSKIKRPQSEIQKIIIHKKKTGSFTGLRIAAAIAQALSLAWQVKIRLVAK
ncbi:MAG: hypothetical protein AAB410_03230 [Patescibacteria group bacterium]